MKKHLLIISALVSTAMGAAAFANDVVREAPPTRLKGGEQQTKATHGGRLPENMTRAEALKKAGDHFDMVDADKDGVVTRSEMKEFREKMRPPFGMEGGARHPDKKSQGEYKPHLPEQNAR